MTETLSSPNVHFSKDETEAQREARRGPRSHSALREEWGSKPRAGGAQLKVHPRSSLRPRPVLTGGWGAARSGAEAAVAGESECW